MMPSPIAPPERLVPLPRGFAVEEVPSLALDPGMLRQAADRLLASMDAVEGGFGRAPKFPHPMGLEFLLRVESRLRSADAAVPVERSCERAREEVLVNLRHVNHEAADTDVPG